MVISNNKYIYKFKKKKLFCFRYWVERWINWFHNEVCFFIIIFVSVFTINIQNNASIFNFSILLNGKVNIVGAFRSSNFKIPNSFQNCREKQHINYGKTSIFTQNWFSTKSILVFEITLKQINVYTWHFYWSFIFAFSIHDKIFKIFWFVLNNLGTFSVSHFISLFFYEFQ